MRKGRVWSADSLTRNHYDQLAPKSPVKGVVVQHLATPIELDPSILERLTLAESVCPVFQPMLDRDMNIMTHEALMRVVDGSGQLMHLGNYVQQMEHHGLISLADIRMAHQVGTVLSEVQLNSVSVNASVRTLQHRMPAYVNALSPARETGTEVIIEITETTPIVDVGRLKDCIEELQDFGFRVALDDAKFDHAYGHPDLIRRCRPDIVKIDGLFFHESLFSTKKMASLEEIVEVSHECGAQVVFEWVDTRDRLEIAMELGADWIQGFLLGVPTSLWTATRCSKEKQRMCGHNTCPIRSGNWR